MNRSPTVGGTLGNSGFALVVVLVILFASTLAVAQLVRAVDTATTATGNVVARDALVPEADRVIAAAMATLADTGAVGNRESDVPDRAYFASRQPGEDAHGFPAALAVRGDAWPQTPTGASSPGTASAAIGEARVIERVCAAPGPPTRGNCTLVVGATAPLYRISVRMSGPGGALVRAQVLVLGDSPPQRVAWRLVLL